MLTVTRNGPNDTLRDRVVVRVSVGQIARIMRRPDDDILDISVRIYARDTKSSEERDSECESDRYEHRNPLGFSFRANCTRFLSVSPPQVEEGCILYSFSPVTISFLYIYMVAVSGIRNGAGRRSSVRRGRKRVR